LGADIRFTSSDGTTLLKYERERHDSANQVAEYWVKIPSVSSSSGTTFYIYYGNASASDGEDATNVWDSNFKIRYSMKDLTTTSVKDSTVNNNDGTKKGVGEPTEIDGKIEKAQEFDGNDDYIGAENTGVFSGGIVTVEFWVYVSSTNGYEGWLGIGQSSSNRMDFVVDRNNLRLQFSSTPSGYWVAGNSNALIDNAWNHVAWYFNQNNNDLKFYTNGVLQDLSYTVDCNTANIKVQIARRIDSTVYKKAKIDEVRISNVARSTAWIKATYHAGNDSLLTFGTEETPVVTYTETYTLDTYLYTQNTQTHTVDALLYKQNAQTNTIDGFLYKTLTVSHTVDSYLPTTRIHTIDSVLYKTYTAGGTYSDPNISYGDDLVNYNGLPTIDAYLYKTTTASVDSVLYKTLTAESSIDSYFRKRLTTSAGIDSYLFAVRSITSSIDSLLYKTYTTTDTLDSYLYKQKTVENYINTYLWGTLELTYTIDGLLWGWNYQDKSTDPSWNYQNKSTDPSWDYQDKSTDPSWDYQDKSTDPSWTYKDKPTDPTWTWKIKR